MCYAHKTRVQERYPLIPRPLAFWDSMRSKAPSLRYSIVGDNGLLTPTVRSISET